MVDFLENTYAHRYAKANQKEIQVTVQRADEVPEKMDVEENESTYSDQEQRPLSEETVPASAAPVNAVSVNEKQYTEDTAGSRFHPEDTGDKLEPTKEARIREILEEFLA